MEAFLSGIEKVISQDFGGRGIDKMWTPGALRAAADKILSTDKSHQSFVLTGFCCLKGSSETDGPLGSTILCSTLCALGFRSSLLCDTPSSSVTIAAAHGNSIFIADSIEKVPPFDLIISIERPGRTQKTFDYRTMRARDITERTMPLDMLFPGIGETRPYVTIAVGDGGNECGTGLIADQVKQNVSMGEDICTDRTCDVLVMAGVSNWGAIAIAAALVVVSQDKNAAETFFKECTAQPEILHKMLDAGAYDGVTGEVTLAIDGMKYENEHAAVTNAIVDLVHKSLSK